MVEALIRKKEIDKVMIESVLDELKEQGMLKSMLVMNERHWQMENFGV